MQFLLLLALPITLLILYFQTHKSKHDKTLHPRAPQGLPFIGNLHQLDARSLHTCLSRLSNKYGPIMSLKLGFRRVVVISSVDALKEIMKSHDLVFSSRPVLVSLHRMSFNGQDIAFSPYNDTWREMKKIATIHLFSTKKVQSFLPIFKDELSKMIDKIASDASSSTITDLSEMMMTFSSNTICRVAFGRSYGGQGHGKNRFFDIIHETQHLLGAFFMEDYIPYLRWFDTLSGMSSRLDKCFWKLNSFYEELIQDHMDPNRPKSMEGDVVDVLLEIRRNGSSPFDLTWDHIKALLANIINGGSDTSSAVLVWALTMLMNKPALRNRVQAEIRELAGTKELIDEQDIEKLPYLRAVIKETMRLYPPAPLLIPRETTQKCSINGYEIEAGTTIYVNARDAATWENAEEFLPERFLETDLDVRDLSPEVTPFGFGRRHCPAIEIGMCEVELALANVLYKFNWELPPGMKEGDINFNSMPGMAMHKKTALRLIAKVVN